MVEMNYKDGSRVVCFDGDKEMDLESSALSFCNCGNYGDNLLTQCTCDVDKFELCS